MYLQCDRVCICYTHTHAIYYDVYRVFVGENTERARARRQTCLYRAPKPDLRSDGRYSRQMNNLTETTHDVIIDVINDKKKKN